MEALARLLCFGRIRSSSLESLFSVRSSRVLEEQFDARQSFSILIERCGDRGEEYSSSQLLWIDGRRKDLLDDGSTSQW